MINSIYGKDSMASEQEADIITRIAWLYYHERLTQQEIGEKLSLSRPKVQRLLERIKDLEIVTFRIKHPHANLLSVEKTLCQKLGLKDAVVVPAVSTDPQVLRKSFARACSDYLERFLRRDDEFTLGFGWGNTTSYLADFFDPEEVTAKVSVVTLIGNLTLNVAMNPYITAEIIARRLGAPFYNIWAPAIAKTKERASIFKSEPWINETLCRAEDTDVAVISIGEVSQYASLVEMGFITKKDLDRLVSKGAVGDIIGRYIDADGKLIEDEIHDRVIGISIESLKKPSTLVIGVAGGESKSEAIQASIKGGFLDILITDENNADRLCRTV